MFKATGGKDNLNLSIENATMNWPFRVNKTDAASTIFNNTEEFSISRGLNVRISNQSISPFCFEFYQFDNQTKKEYEFEWRNDSSNEEFKINRVRGIEYLNICPNPNFKGPLTSFDIYIVEEFWYGTPLMWTLFIVSIFGF